MKLESYECDTCKKKYSSDKSLLRIGDYNTDNLIIRNHLPNRRIISIDNHDPIHFCSKACFLEYFFMDEGSDVTSKSL